MEMATTEVRIAGHAGTPEDVVPDPPKTPVCPNNNLLSAYCFIKNIVSASGTSAVAIDNKIEQAMDLVKSHLMFAVREEVEVLREKIAELMDRINLLELENSVLKQQATPETLATLAAQVTASGVGGGGGGGGQAPPN